MDPENSSLKEKQAAYLHNFDRHRNDVPRTICRRLRWFP